MITRYDSSIIAFCFVFILVIGAVFRRLSNNTSGYDVRALSKVTEI